MNAHASRDTVCRFERALVIDDHPLYCAALGSALARVFPDCAIETSTTLESGLATLRGGFVPDMIVLDLKLPDVTGISGFLRLKDAVGSVPILINSALASPEVVESLLDAGARGFVPKDVSIEVLQEAFAEVCAGRIYVPVGYRPGERDAGPRIAEMREVARRIADLTPQQNRIMKLICEGLPNKQIAYELSLAEATVKAHITAILRRLEVQNRTQAALLMEGAALAEGEGPEQADVRSFLSH